MKLETSGILLGLRAFSEKDLIGIFFTQDYGLLSGIIKAGQVSKRKLQTGMLGLITWSARLENHLGTIHFENQKNLSAKIMMNYQKLLCLTAMFDILMNALPERQDQDFLYNETLAAILKIEHKNHFYEYSLWEIKLLNALGYALDLSKCGNCGQGQDLVYISPKTGRSVCKTCGNEYRDRMLKLPNLLYSYNDNPEYSEINDIVCIASHFFEKIAFVNDGFTIPESRDRLVATIKSLL